MSLTVKEFPSEVVVDYANFRSQIRTGDLLLCSSSKLIAKVTQFGTKSIWTHVALVVNVDSLDRILVLESVETFGVRAVRLSKYLTDYDNQGNPYKGGLVLVRHKNYAQQQMAHPEAENAMLRAAMDRLGCTYDWGDIAKIMGRYVAHELGFGEWLRKKIKPNNNYICSEYVDVCYRTFGLNVQWDEKGFIAPSHFAADSAFELIAVLQQL